MPASSFSTLPRRTVRFALWGILASLPGLPAAAAQGGTGILVDEVRRGSTADRAGLLPGDLLVSWRRAASPPANPQPSAGELRSPFDLMDVLVEQLPRGEVTLSGRRDDSPRSWILPAGRSTCWFVAESMLSVWEEKELRTLPRLSPALASRLAEGRGRLEAGDIDGGIAAWKDLAAGVLATGDRLNAAWALGRTAQLLALAERWEGADSNYRRAAGLAAPVSPSASAHLLRAWGNTLLERRAWSLARDAFEHAWGQDRKAHPGGLAEAWSITGLGHFTALGAGSQDSSDLYRRALEIRRREGPGSSDVAASAYDTCLEGWLALDHRAAADACATANTLQGALSPRSLYQAEALVMLGRNLVRLGHLEPARQTFESAAGIVERQAPDDLLGAFVSQGLGQIARRQGELETARRRFAEAVARWRPAFPSVAQRAQEWEFLRELGNVELRLGDKRASRDHLCQAVALGEAYRQRFLKNPVEYRRLVGEVYADDFRGCILALFDTGEKERAFEQLEKSRARTFLNNRAERGLRFAVLETPEAGRFRRLDAEYDRVQAALDDPGRSKDKGTWFLQGRLREIGWQKEEVIDAMRRRFPQRFQNDSATLGLAASRAALAPGTSLLAYVVAEERSLVFVLGSESAGPAGELQVVELPVGERELRPSAERLRRLLQDPGSDVEIIRREGAVLYDLLVRPVEAALFPSHRWLILADGPLHHLPFSVLVRDGRYLIEERSLHVALSTTVYDHLRRLRRAGEGELPLDLAVFADPVYPRLAPEEIARIPDLTVRSALERGLVPLPATRREARRIAALFSRTRVYLGPEAAEGRVAAAGRRARYLHFAVHGLLDSWWSQNSALALTIPRQLQAGRDNGILQGWEIGERLRLSSELVTLSACDTAVGREMGGEGLLSLTEAFHQAGARSVVATLWSVSDEATVAVMEAFYRALRDGQAKDEALRTAQISRIRSRDDSHPFFWAAFQLSGDWR